MHLEGPSDIRRSHQQDGNLSLAPFYELHDRPVLQHKADDEHQYAQGPEDSDRWYLAVVAISDP